MPELTVLSGLWAILRDRTAALHGPENRDVGADIVSYVVLVALIIGATIGIVALLMNRIRDRASSIPLG